MNIFDYIDHIFYINLDKRVDRKIRTEEEIKKIDSNLNHVTRIPGVTIINPKTGKIDGHLGCAIAHIECAKVAKEKNYKRFIVFEDDFYFNKDVEEVQSKIIQFFECAPKDWYMFLLGTYKTFEYVPFKSDFYFVKKSMACTSYIVNETCIDDWIKIGVENISNWLTNKKHTTIDGLWFGYQSNNKVYTANTESYRLVKQIDGFSDIRKDFRKISW